MLGYPFPEFGEDGIEYVLDSLEAALSCFYHAGTYGAAVLLADNLGDDADTTAAARGQIAGAYYGYDSIPKEWKKRLYMHEKIVRLADQLGFSGIYLD
jgi:ADP-ribosyl-[dinitrogen reductase] hydrolase